jgi:tRNA(Ile)-lysidine synthase
VFDDRLAAYAAERCGLAPGPVRARPAGSPGGARLAVGTSGGVDSTVLFLTLRALGYDAVAVYVHHGLRAEADDEAAFVTAMAREAGAESAVVRAAVGAGNRQGAARRARYAALGEAARTCGSAVIAVGHTATDQAETVLMALVRGAGLRGLAGMDPRRTLDAGRPDGPALVRPLLWATRAEVEAEARARGWTWREDASNAGDAYRRNRIRHHVLPLLEAEGGPETATRIAAAADAVRAALDTGPTAILERIGTPDARGGSVTVDGLRALSDSDRAAVLAEALRTYAPGAPRSRTVVASVGALVGAAAGTRVGLAPVTVWRDRARLRFVVEMPGAGSGNGDGLETPLGRLVRAPLDAVPTGFSASPFVETVDADVLGGPLVLRPWRAGDRIVPVGGGGGGERRVADVLRDAGVEPSERAAQLVLVHVAPEGERIVWVVGARLAAWAGVTPDTRRAERLEWVPSGAGAVVGDSRTG